MNKIEAATFLEIGVRTLERYMSQGRIAYTRQRGKTGEAVVFTQTELERFKEELHLPTHEGVIAVRQGSPRNSSGMVNASQVLAEIGDNLVNISEGIDSVLFVLKEMLKKPQVAIHSKHLLTLNEAQNLSGLSRQFLLQAINSDRLAGEKIGKSWRVKRRDLERFANKLF